MIQHPAIESPDTGGAFSEPTLPSFADFLAGRLSARRQGIDTDQVPVPASLVVADLPGTGISICRAAIPAMRYVVAARQRVIFEHYELLAVGRSAVQRYANRT